jgi:hypothetical protein
VEAALLAFLTPTEPVAQEAVILKRLLDMEEVLGQVVGVLRQLLALQEALRPKPAPPPVATYEQMYGPMDAAPEREKETPEPAVEPMSLDAGQEHARPAPRQGWRRWFVREES